jgi:hypothetical protein
VFDWGLVEKGDEEYIRSLSSGSGVVRVGDLGMGTGVSDLTFASFLSFEEEFVEDVLEMGRAEIEEVGFKSEVVPDELVEGCVLLELSVVVVDG